MRVQPNQWTIGVWLAILFSRHPIQGKGERRKRRRVIKANNLKRKKEKTRRKRDNRPPPHTARLYIYIFSFDCMMGQKGNKAAGLSISPLDCVYTAFDPPWFSVSKKTRIALRVSLRATQPTACDSDSLIYCIVAYVLASCSNPHRNS
jgi:hypothetical protein